MTKPSAASSPARKMNITGSTSSQKHTVQTKEVAFKRTARSTLATKLELLPSDILRTIISRLSLKEAARMSTLSHEWRRLRICHPNLVFTKRTFFPANYGISLKDRELMVDEFITKVNNAIRPLWHTSSTTTTIVDKFVVKFPLRKKHKNKIDRWIHFSATSRAKHVSLDFSGRDCMLNQRYVVPLGNLTGQNGSSVESLDLRYVYLKTPSSFFGITNLRKLALRNMSIIEGDLQCLLLHCALLEYLSIEECFLMSLSISQEMYRLRHLKVNDTSLEIIELHAPNLVKFEFGDNTTTKIVLGDSLKLTEATFTLKKRRPFFRSANEAFLEHHNGPDPLGYVLAELPTVVPHVHKLLLHMSVRATRRFTRSGTGFVNLRHVNLNLKMKCSASESSWFAGLVHVLELAPRLEELELHLGNRTYAAGWPGTVTAMGGPMHAHLRSVYISGFQAVLGLAEVALYILGNATALERMVVDPVVRMKCKRRGFHSARDASGGSRSATKGTRPAAERREAVSNARKFADKHLGREEFRHIVTIL